MAKKRGFEIDFDETENSGVPAGKSERRGPMASAIVEASEAIDERAEAEAAIREENDRLAHELVDLKRAGLITTQIPIANVRTDKLLRDRSENRDTELDELKKSIREVGLANPIRVEDAGDHYELIQGFRRLTAYTELYQETGDKKYASIPAGIYSSNAKLPMLYRRMVDENLIRKNVSFGEMAALAWGYVRIHSSDITKEGIEAGVDELYASASRQKRAYIKSFARMLRTLEGFLTHIEVIPRALGLAVSKKLEAEPRSAETLRNRLEAVQGQGALAELEVLRNFSLVQRTAAPKQSKETVKTTLKLESPRGQIRVTATDGTFTMKSKVDFSQIGREELEAAIAAFWAEIE